MILKKRENAITLIALVITIVILLILVGIVISQLMSNGLFIKSRIAEQRTKYVSAKERLETELMAISTDCIGYGKEYNITEIAKGMKDVSDITIEKYYNSDIALIKTGVIENIVNLTGIVVSVNDYSEYKFLLGKDGNITGILVEKIEEDTEKEKFKKIEDFEKELFGENIVIADDDSEEEIEVDPDKRISYVLNSKILEDENNRYTELVDITGNDNNANAYSLDSNDDETGIVFNGSSSSAIIDLKQELTFPMTVEMMIKTSTNSKTEIFYLEPNLGVCFGNWVGDYFICTVNTSTQVIPIPSDFYDGGLKHIIVTYNSFYDFEVYINGEKQEKSTSKDYFNSDGDKTFYLGRRARGNFFEGILYSFRIYNKILSESEIMLSYNKDKNFLENEILIEKRENTVLEYIVKNNEDNIYTKFKTNKIEDISKNNNNATAHDITYNDDKDGGIFNGTTSYVDVNKKEELTFPMTVEMMIKTSTNSKTEIFYLEPNSGVCFGNWVGDYFICTVNTSTQVIPIPSDFYDGGLKHIIVTYNSFYDFEVYINGEKQEKSTSKDYFNSDGDKTFYLGKRARGNFFEGVFYEFNVYSRVLNEDEILNNYNKAIKYEER